jgi:hypothetical protein
MYEIDERDRALELRSSVPQSSGGAPLPLILSDEFRVAVAYYTENTPQSWDGRSVRMLTPDSDEPWAIVTFDSYAHMFGPPNDEAFRGHPLAERGLTPYAFFVILNSSWLRGLERMNSVHPHHSKNRFMQRKHHFVLSFHDSTFECIASGFTVRTGSGPLSGTIPLMLETLSSTLQIDDFVLP